jgi:hypothetical protein
MKARQPYGFDNEGIAFALHCSRAAHQGINNPTLVRGAKNKTRYARLGGRLIEDANDEARPKGRHFKGKLTLDFLLPIPQIGLFFAPAPWAIVV